jgi:hypothetical protein
MNEGRNQLGKYVYQTGLYFAQFFRVDQRAASMLF